MSPVRIRIRLMRGQWYACASGGNRKGRNLMLVSAISFCKRLNAKATGSAAA